MICYAPVDIILVLFRR